MCGKLAPDYDNLELRVGGSVISTAICEATGIARAKLRDMYNQLGDIGDVAQVRVGTLLRLGRFEWICVLEVVVLYCC